MSARRRWFGGSPRDAAVRHAARLGRRERVLAVAALDGGATAVASRDALAVVEPAAQGRPSLRWRRGWYEVDAGTWDALTRTLHVTWVGGGVDDLPVAGDASTRLPEVLRERVQSSVVATRRVEVRGARGVRLVVRRGPQGLLLQEIADRGIDPGDAGTAARVAAAREELASEVGLSAG